MQKEAKLIIKGGREGGREGEITYQCTNIYDKLAYFCFSTAAILDVWITIHKHRLRTRVNFQHVIITSCTKQ